MKSTNWLKKIFTKEKKEPPKEEKKLDFEEELNQLKKRVDEFLLTQKKERGTIIEHRNFTLKKQSENFFHLEGKEESGRTYHIYLSTQNFLLENNQKITGVINVNEVDLNHLISENHTSLKSFFSNAKNLNLQEKSLKVLEMEQDFNQNWKDIFTWNHIWKQKLLAELSPNISALMCVYLEKFDTFFQENSSKRQKDMITEELFFLSQDKNSQEFSPNTKNHNLFEFSTAYEKFFQILKKTQKKMESNL